MPDKYLPNLCFVLTLLCGVGTVAVAIFMPGDNPSFTPLLTTLSLLFTTGVTAFFFKALGG